MSRPGLRTLQPLIIRYFLCLKAKNNRGQLKVEHFTEIPTNEQNKYLACCQWTKFIAAKTEFKIMGSGKKLKLSLKKFSDKDFFLKLTEIYYCARWFYTNFWFPFINGLFLIFNVVLSVVMFIVVVISYQLHINSLFVHPLGSKRRTW